ncbi:MAG: hypothetical protein MZV64_05155 [Ignavibacteriales bacterium]|nr:hypothetical protein [Ignavibacteriales bacterium]
MAGRANINEYRWLLISSVAMGLALGTKYNALVAWFFLDTGGWCLSAPEILAISGRR